MRCRRKSKHIRRIGQNVIKHYFCFLTASSIITRWCLPTRYVPHAFYFTLLSLAWLGSGRRVPIPLHQDHWYGKCHLPASNETTCHRIRSRVLHGIEDKQFLFVFLFYFILEWWKRNTTMFWQYMYMNHNRIYGLDSRHSRHNSWLVFFCYSMILRMVFQLFSIILYFGAPVAISHHTR